MEKRYYWLKLRQDVLQSPYLRGLRREPGGAVYTLIYFKMALLTLNSGGKLVFLHTADCLESEIAYTIGETPEDVKQALSCLCRLHLCEKKGRHAIFLPDVSKNIGTECDSARRMRESRERKASNGDRAVTEKLQHGYTDIEKEKEKDTERDTETEGGAVSPVKAPSFITPRTRRRDGEGGTCNLFKQMLREEDR